MNKYDEYLSFLGHKVEEVTTGLTGVVTSIGFDIAGCVQAIVHPGVDKDGKLRDPVWFDLSRLKKVGPTPVMDSPHFSINTGSEIKPAKN